MQNFNWIDYVIVGVLFLSIFVGFARGFLKEAISLATWIAAAVVASQFAAPLASNFAGASNAAAQSAFGNSAVGATAVQSLSVLSIAISFIVLFMGTLLIGALVGYFVTSVATGTGLGFLNRLMGAAFGAVRGFLIAVMLIFVAQLTPLANQSFWGQSQLVPQFQPAVIWFSNLAGPEIQAIETQARSLIGNVSNQLPNVGSLFQGFTK
ncbi:MAG: CvpA family protein [Gammaproteobacteria bacterium]|nr:CvpA family protein [Gammaproteobacteria bacterium]